MTVPQPPIVPAPPPEAAGPPTAAAAAAKPAAVKAPPKPPILGRPQRPVRPGLAAAGGGGVLAVSAAAGAVVGGPVGAVAVPLGVAGVTAGAVAVHRRLQRDPEKQAARAAKTATRTPRVSMRDRMAARRADRAARPRTSLRDRLAAARSGLTPAARRATPRSAGSGSKPGGRGRAAASRLPGLSRRPAAGAGGRGKSGPGRLARMRPGAKGRQARAAHAAGQARAGGAVTPRRPGKAERRAGKAAAKTARRQAKAARQADGWLASAAGLGGGRSRAGRVWDRRPGSKRRAQRAAAADTAAGGGKKAKGGAADTTPTPGTGRRSWLRRKPRTPATEPAPPAGGAKTDKKAVEKPPVRETWSTRRRDRHTAPGLPVARSGDRSLRTGKPLRWWQKLGRRTGTTTHTPTPPPADPSRGGGVGPVPPKDGGPKPAGPAGNVRRAGRSADDGYDDERLHAWVKARAERARREQAAASASAGGPLTPSGSKLAAARNARHQEPEPPDDPDRADRLAAVDELNRTQRAQSLAAGGIFVGHHGPGCGCDTCTAAYTEAEHDAAVAEELRLAGAGRLHRDADEDRRWHDRRAAEQAAANAAARRHHDRPPQDDASWAAGFRPGPAPATQEERTAARDRWQRRTEQGGTSMSGISMRDEWAPRVAALGDMFREAQAYAASLAADIEPGGSAQPVKDMAAEIAGAAATLAGSADALDAESHTADATAHSFMEEKNPAQAQDWM
jgi:hypothetical protein